MCVWGRIFENETQLDKGYFLLFGEGKTSKGCEWIQVSLSWDEEWVLG